MVNSLTFFIIILSRICLTTVLSRFSLVIFVKIISTQLHALSPPLRGLVIKRLGVPAQELGSNLKKGRKSIVYKITILKARKENFVNSF